VTRRGGERGQATVEIALVLPFVALFAVVAAQLGAVGMRQLALGNAARAGARAAAVAADPVGAGTDAALAATSVRPLDVEVDVATTTVRVRVHHDAHLGVGPLSRDVELSAEVVMVLEPP
jgi:Flp pilus assembly protein TadG